MTPARRGVAVQRHDYCKAQNERCTGVTFAGHLIDHLRRLAVVERNPTVISSDAVTMPRASMVFCAMGDLLLSSGFPSARQVLLHLRATSHVTVSGLARERQAGPRPADRRWELERWTRVGYERRMRFRKGER
jgi:hypothetical protein